MASVLDADTSVELLRAKYAELTRKYAQVVQRLERRSTQELGSYRAISLQPRFSAAAFAVVGPERIEMANARFVQLHRSLRGPLLPIDHGAAVQHPNLRSLVVAEADRIVAQGRSAVDLRYRDAGSDALLSLRLELNGQMGRPLIFVSAEDISEDARRDQELTRTREAMLHRERLRVLGELAASVAHDLGNTLRGASFQLAILGDVTMTAAKRAEALRAVGQRIELASEAIARLHEFAQTGSMRATAVHLDRVLAQAVALVLVDFQSASSPIRVRLSAPELPAVRGSIAELSLLFVNLLRNARDAMAEGGTITVEARQMKGGVVVRVADQGTGIAPAVQRRLFEPFFTTKGLRGTGLGLWLAAGTMERLGGTIKAFNRSRGGASFVLTFPLVGRGGGEAAPAPASSPQVRSSARRRGAARRAPSAPAPRPRRRAPRT